jgi:hypothetical protein
MAAREEKRMREKPRRPQGGKKKQAGEPQVGIFWLVRGTLLIDRAPVSEAEPYGDFLTHAAGHDKAWERFQSVGAAPQDMEYDEPPRGRVMYDTKAQTFSLLADECILKRKDLIAKIKEDLHLRKKTKLGKDSHYRCFTCLYGTGDDED